VFGAVNYVWVVEARGAYPPGPLRFMLVLCDTSFGATDLD